VARHLRRPRLGGGAAAGALLVDGLAAQQGRAGGPLASVLLPHPPAAQPPNALRTPCTDTPACPSTPLQVQGSQLVAAKLTGDPNVPAGEVSFIADLAAAEQQQQQQQQAARSFELPQGYRACVDLRPGAHSLVLQQRLPVQGQIASAGFDAPRWTAAELLTFSRRCFGLLWTELRTFALFTRLEL
jgi:hypothetical protein